MDNEFSVLIGAILDSKAKGDLKRQLDNIKDLEVKITNAKLDPSAIQAIRNQLSKNGISLNVNLGNATNLQSEAQKVGKQVGSTMNKAIKSEMANLSSLVPGANLSIDTKDLKTIDAIVAKVKEEYAAYGQVTTTIIKNGEELDKIRVKIQQVNGEMKKTATFDLTKNGNTLASDDQVKIAESMIQHLNQEKNIVNETGDAINAQKKALADQEKYYNKIIDAQKRLANLQKKRVNTVDGGAEQAEIDKQIKAAKQAVRDNYSQLNKKGLIDNTWEQRVNGEQRVQDKAQAVYEAHAKDTAELKEQNQLLKIQQNLQNQTYTTAIAKNSNTLKQYADDGSGTYTATKQSIADMQKAYNAMANSDGTARIQAEKEYQQALKTTQNLLKQITANNDNKLISSDNVTRAQWIEKINASLLNNTKMSKQAKTQLREYLNTLQSGASISQGTFNSIKAGWSDVINKEREANRLGLNAWDKLKQAWGKFGGWSIATGSLMTMVTKTREAVSELVELDNILTEISKTSNATKQQLQELGEESFDAASKYGRKASDYLTSVQEMNRSGFQGKQGTDMAELSLMAQSAGDMTEEVADAYLLATNAAYKYEGQAKRLNEVLDGQNEITNRNSVSMSDMASATSQAASMAQQTGVTVEQLSSLIGTAVARTKKSGDEVGNALKSIFINLQNTTNKKIVSTFESVGISMTKMANGSEVLKTPIELLKELSQVYNALPEGDTKRANIIQNIGGKILPRYIEICN